jgi:hypothetical protein
MVAQNVRLQDDDSSHRYDQGVTKSSLRGMKLVDVGCGGGIFAVCTRKKLDLLYHASIMMARHFYVMCGYISGGAGCDGRERYWR